MSTGIQFTGNLAASASGRWFTHSWPAAWHVIWYMVPTNPRPGAPQLEWSVSVERQSATLCTYWLTIRNLTPSPLSFEGRYAILS